MKFKDILKQILSLVLLLTVILPSSAIAAADTAAAEGGITVVLSEDGKHLDISCESPSSEYYLVMTSPDGTFLPLQKLSEGKNEISVKCENDTYLYSKYSICKFENEAYTPIFDGAYITNCDILAQNRYDMPKPFSKKGLRVRLMSDAQQLGIAHTVIDIALNEMITDDASSSQMINIDGRSYFFNSSYVNLLDHKIKVLTDSNINVYAQIVLSSPSNTKSESAKKLYYKTDVSSAKYYGVNPNGEKASEYYYAALKFIASRYTVENGKYGFVGNYIIGNTVNSNRYGNYAGQMALSDYVSDYTKIFRTAYAAIKGTYSNAVLYTSVNGCFNAPTRDGTPDFSLDYTAYDFLSSFNSQINKGGSIPWHLCAEIDTADISKSDFWNESVFSSSDTPYVTMKNPDVLTSLINSGDFECGYTRYLTVSGCAFTGGDNSKQAQKKQAAAYSLAYYTAEADPLINAFIYSSHVDLKTDEYINSGLYTRREDTFQLADKTKEIYEVFKYIDTASSSIYTADYKNIIGAFYSDIIDGHTSEQEKRIVMSGLFKSVSGRKVLHTFDFSKGVSGFYPSDNAYSASVRTDGEEKHLYCVTYNSDLCEYRGVCRMLHDIPLDGAGYIKFDITPECPDGVETVDVMCRLWGRDENGKSVVYEGVSQIPSEGCTTLSYYIKDFVSLTKENTDGMKIWIRPHSDKDGGEYNMCISNVSFLSSSFSFKIILTVLLVILAIGAVAFAVYFFVFKRPKKEPAVFRGFDRRKLKK
ncbi:MAG: hypothetical protein IKL21_05995 [Clostridia bacterium]|nr:hypothetical protein [Clostridia bacterium]